MKNIGNGTEKASGEIRAVVKHRTSASGAFSAVPVKRLLTALLCLVVSWLMSGAEAFPGTYPFGVATVSAVTGISAVIPTLAGALLGYAGVPTVGGAYAILVTVLAVTRIGLSVWLLSEDLHNGTGSRARAMRKKLYARVTGAEKNERLPVPFRRALMLSENAGERMLHENVCVRMSLSACTALMCGAWSVVKGGFSYYDLFGTLFMVLFTPLVTYFFYAVADRRMRTSPMREVGIYVTGAILTYAVQNAFSGTGLSGGASFSAGIMLAFSAAVVCANRYGLYRGVLLGICCGAFLDTTYLPMFALSAVVSAVIGGYSMTLAVLSSGVLSVAWSAYSAGFAGLADVVPPVVAACAVLVPLYRCGLVRLPDNAFGGAVRNADMEIGLAKRERDGMAGRMDRLSDGLCSVSTILCGMSERLSRPGREEMRGICESAFGTYCRGCAIRGKCRDCTKSRTAPVIEAMTAELLQNGAVSASVIPSSLASSCFNIGRILDEINRVAGERIAMRRINDKLAVTSSDFGLAGEIIRAAHDEEVSVSRPDTVLSGKLRQLLTYRDFTAGSVSVYGGRVKRILVRDVDLTSTRMGGDDIRRLFERTAGLRLSEPEFGLDGAILSMSLHSVPAFSCVSGRAFLSASSAGRYRYCSDSDDENGGLEDHAESEERELVCEGNEGEEIKIDVTDVPPDEACGVCGDTIAAFEANGRYYMLISDGMGSGREAALTSEVCATVLQRLICAGAGTETALKLLNNVIRAGERECSATVDIAEIDLMTGEARFIKSGAAPSFVLRDGSIFRLQSKTVPIGILRALDAEMIGFRVEAGDRVIMVSDGVARSYEEVPWLLDMMVSDEVILRGSAKSAAMKIVREAARRGSSDDITAGVLCIDHADISA